MDNTQTPSDVFPMVAKTFQGLEEVLAQELILLGAKNVEIGQRMVSFEGNLEIMYKANLCCRTALRILKPIAKFTAEDPDELYDRVRDLDWSEFLSPELTFSVDSTISGSRFTHSKYVTYRVKDGIVDYFQDKCGKRPSVRLEGADRMLNVHIFENRVTISLDSSGEPLSKRGYKVENTEAPINEVLAAGIIMMTGWRGDVDFMDPMCGSGTFLTEAAMIAANINPGIYRQGFAFEKWDDFDADLFESIYNDDSQERDVMCRITGSDKDPMAVAIANANKKNARLDNMITVECMSMSEARPTAEEGVLVTNPPYGRRLRPGDMDSLWSRIGSDLKSNFTGWHAWIIGMTDEQFAEIGFKPSTKISLHNGALECSLREYVIFAGRYNDFRAGGNSVKEDNGVIAEGVTRGRHLSDREWDRETRKYGNTGGKPRKMREERDQNQRGGRGKGEGREYKKEYKKEFRKENRKESRKESGREFRDDFNCDDFNKGHRDDFRKGGKRDSKKDFRKKDAKGGFGGNDGGRRYGEPRKVVDKGPRLENYTETRFGNGFGLLRSRRKGNNRDFNNEEE